MRRGYWAGVVMLVLLVVAAGFGTGCGNESGSVATPTSSAIPTVGPSPSSGTTPTSGATPAAGAKLAVLTGDSSGRYELQSSPFSLNAGDSLEVRYSVTRGSGPVHPTVVIRLSTWSDSPVDVASLTLDKAGKGYGPPWTAPDDGQYTVSVESVNAEYRITVTKK
jgi:hypothetical protein